MSEMMTYEAFTRRTEWLDPDAVTKSSCYVRQTETRITNRTWCERECESLKSKGIEASIRWSVLGQVAVFAFAPYRNYRVVETEVTYDSDPRAAR